MDKQKQEQRAERFVLTSNEGIIVTLPESAYKLLRGETDGKVNDDSETSGNRK